MRMILLRIAKYGFALALVYILIVVYALYKPYHVPKSEWKPANQPFPGDKANNIFWFVQVSDIHISRFYDEQRGPDFKKFCSNTLETIDPEVVLVTGDLTDAKTKNRYDSEQYQDEWETYNKILTDTKVLEKYTWLDVRGNHDAFNVISRNSPENFYNKLSGSKGKLSSQAWNLVKSYGKYSFIPVDASMMPGPRRPFNFFGHLSSSSMQHLEAEAQRSVKSNVTMWYGHFPTPTISSMAPLGIRNLLGRFGSVYFCGHLHDIGGLFPHLQAIHPAGFLELELRDWKYSRKYRIVSVDHDLLSFTDTSLHEWPVVVVTNPKAATLMIPRHEPIGRIAKSTHIRFLAFSPHGIEKASVTIDGVPLDGSRHVEGPLWVCKWHPSLHTSGTHNLTIVVEDNVGNINSQTSMFSLDDHWQRDFYTYATIILLTDFCTLGQVAFSLMICVAISTLIMVKYFGVGVSSDRSFIMMWLFRLQILISDNLSFYGLTSFLVNLAIGPLFIGELITGHTGVCFTYGIFIDGKLISEKSIYFHVIFLMLFQYFSFIAYVSYFAEKRWKENLTLNQSFRTRAVLMQVMLCGIFMINYRTCREVYLSYGTMALLLSPAKLWWSMFVVFLTLRCWGYDVKFMIKR